MVQMHNKSAERDPLVRMAKMGQSEGSSKRVLCFISVIVLLVGMLFLRGGSDSPQSLTEQTIESLHPRKDVITSDTSKSGAENVAPLNDDDPATDDFERHEKAGNNNADGGTDDTTGDSEESDSNSEDSQSDSDDDGASNSGSSGDDDYEDDDDSSEEGGDDDDSYEEDADDDENDKEREGEQEKGNGDGSTALLESGPENENIVLTETDEQSSVKTSLPGAVEDWAWIIEHEHVPPLTIQDFSLPLLLENFYKARQAMYEKLQRDYGAETFRSMFLRENDISVGRTALISPHNASRSRFIRKLVMKILQGQIRAVGEGRRNLRRSLQQDDTKYLLPFVWATGGHSSAAGHGNYYNESYTAQMERMGREVFAAAGMHLVGRNFAMGGTSSGLEVGSCVDQIFGLDIDVLSWDFGMTDGRGVGIFENYFSHAAIHPNRPAMVGLNLDSSGRPGIVGQLEENGLPIMFMSQDEVDQVLDAVPDTLGLNQQEIDSMPPFVRYFKCDNKLESGEPGCGEFKFSQDHCPDRRFRTSWHQGWRWHGTYGNVIALSLTEMLEDALKYLIERETYVAEDLLDQLRNEESEDYRKFFESDILEFGREDIVPDDEQKGLDMKMILRKRPFCRTCRLPAEARYLGLMTETAAGDMLHYEKGISIREATSQPNGGTTMRLVWDAKDRQTCDVPLNQDYKDYYIVTSMDGWQSVTLPNDREAAYYGTGEAYNGLIMLTMPGCDWGKCPLGDIREDGFETGKFEMEVNGIKVTKLTKAWGSHFLRHGEGETLFPPNNDGRFEIRVRVNGDGVETGFVRFSAFTIW